MDKYKKFFWLFLAGYMILIVVVASVYKLYVSEYIGMGRWKTKQERFCKYLSFNEGVCRGFGCLVMGGGLCVEGSKCDGSEFLCLPPTWNK